MLGINYKDVPSYPVGYVEYLEMYSLDFEEFLWASGVSEQSIEDIKGYFERRSRCLSYARENGRALPWIYHRRNASRRQEFVTRHNFADALRLQRAIVTDYTDDIAKYADGAEKTKARTAFFQYLNTYQKTIRNFNIALSRIEVLLGNTAEVLCGSMMPESLISAIISRCLNCRLKAMLKVMPLRSTWEIQVCWCPCLGDGSQEDIIDGSLGIYKGAIYENIIADIFAKSGKKLYYFEYNSQIEIDFFIRRNKKAIAVEVKSAENKKAKSLDAIIENYGVQGGIKLSPGNVGTFGKVEVYPLYMRCSKGMEVVL